MLTNWKMPILGKFRTSSPDQEDEENISLAEKRTSPIISPWEATEFSVPPRYRLRDLLLGEFAFNDDGER